MSSHARRTAILPMCASVCVIPVVDTIAKVLTDVVSAFFLVAARYAIGTVLALLLFRSPKRAYRSLAQSPVLHVSRSAILVGAMVCFYWAIADIPVATALGGYFTGPVIAAVLSIILLGEKARAVTFCAVALGFAGALLILRPEAGVSSGSVLALLSGVLSGAYLVLTRTASLSLRPEDNVLIQSLIGALLVAPVAVFSLPAFDPTVVGLIGLMGVLSFLAHALFLIAFRALDVGTLAPLAYLEIAVAALLGWALFGDVPTLLAWGGILCVVAAGLLIAAAPGSVPVTSVRE